MKVYFIEEEIKIGNPSYNFEILKKHYKIANENGHDILLTSELFVCGYSPQDLLLSEQFLLTCDDFCQQAAKLTKQKNCLIFLGVPEKYRGRLYNSCFVLSDGKIICKSRKATLAKKEVFDDDRYFTTGKNSIFEFKNNKIGIIICEDLWHKNRAIRLKNLGATHIFCLNASPFYIGKMEERLFMVKNIYNITKLPIYYSNQLANQDGILYDGSSFIFDKNGVSNYKTFNKQKSTGSQLQIDAICFGLKSYLTNKNIKKVIIGISGGADSTLVLALAKMVIKTEDIIPVFMPSKITSEESKIDATVLCKNLGLKMQTIPISEITDQFSKNIEFSGVAAENIQARIRGVILMTLANQLNAFVLTTGNKSEIATGYCTLYGDMCGGYNPIKDLYKTEVFALLKSMGDKIPQNIITKEPTAELRENQKDSDSLPPYEILDKILRDFIEYGQICDHPETKRVLELVSKAEYKRRQAAIGPKLSRRSFEAQDWRQNT